MLQTKTNEVHIEGILSEIDLKPTTFRKNGAEQPAISGSIKVRVNQKINGVDTELEVPVYMFSGKYTNAGGENPAYKNIEQIMNEYISIAASDEEHADRVSISRATMTMNEYYGQNGKLISFPRVRASFAKRLKKEECVPDASFKIVFAVGNKGYEVDHDGVETDRYRITGAVPQYGGAVDVIPFYAINKGVIDGVSQYWNEGDTVSAAGKLNFTSRTETRMVEVDFGEPQQETRTISVSELILTGGSGTPLTGDFAIDTDELKEALAARKAKLEELKNKASNQGASGHAPSRSSQFKDLGF